MSIPEPSIPEAFYLPQPSGVFGSTELTRGPWDHGSQHAGPPGALIGRALRLHGGEQRRDWQIGRITYEILGPVPIGALRVEVETIRPGRSVELLSARLLSTDGGEAGVEAGLDRPLIRARAWRIRTAGVDLPEGLESVHTESPTRQAGRPTGAVGAIPGPEGLDSDGGFFAGAAEVGYHVGVEYRFVRGSFGEPGAGTAWMRMRRPLVAGEDPDPLTRVLIVADSGNGVSSPLDIRTHLFINVDLTVNLHRLPQGDWICLDSLSTVEPSGIGMSDTALFDETGPIGRAAQTLLIANR